MLLPMGRPLDADGHRPVVANTPARTAFTGWANSTARVSPPTTRSRGSSTSLATYRAPTVCPRPPKAISLPSASSADEDPRRTRRATRLAGSTSLTPASLLEPCPPPPRTRRQTICQFLRASLLPQASTRRFQGETRAAMVERRFSADTGGHPALLRATIEAADGGGRCASATRLPRRGPTGSRGDRSTRKRVASGSIIPRGRSSRSGRPAIIEGSIPASERIRDRAGFSTGPAVFGTLKRPARWPFLAFAGRGRIETGCACPWTAMRISKTFELLARSGEP